MKRSILGASKVGACLGFVIACLVLTYGYLEPKIHAPAINDWLIFMLCPSSIALMAADAGNWLLFVCADLVVVAANTGWYGFLFAVFAKLVSPLRAGEPERRPSR